METWLAIPDSVIPIIPIHVKEFAIKRCMRLENISGQRIFGPSLALHPSYRPPDGCELFIGRIPRSVDETVLVPLFEMAGSFFQMRMMVNFSGTNKGYCFVTYYHPEQATFAKSILNGMDISQHFPKVRSSKLAAVKSMDNRKLVIRGIPSYKGVNEVFQELNRVHGGILQVSIPEPSYTYKAICYVEYATHKTAAVARSKMLEIDFHPWGFEIEIDWAEPEVVEDPFLVNQPQVIHVENLSDNTSLDTIQYLFGPNLFPPQQHGVAILAIKRCRLSAVIQYATRAQAENAMMTMNGAFLDGNQIFVHWSKPKSILQPNRQTRKRRWTSQTPPQVPMKITRYHNTAQYTYQNRGRKYHSMIEIPSTTQTIHRSMEILEKTEVEVEDWEEDAVVAENQPKYDNNEEDPKETDVNEVELEPSYAKVSSDDESLSQFVSMSCIQYKHVTKSKKGRSIQRTNTRRIRYFHQQFHTWLTECRPENGNPGEDVDTTDKDSSTSSSEFDYN